jgi:hypothetical protein
MGGRGAQKGVWQRWVDNSHNFEKFTKDQLIFVHVCSAVALLVLLQR